MQQVKCSHCGAAFSGGVFPDEQGMFTCSYCGKASYATPPASAAPPVPATYIIIQHGPHAHDDDDDDDDRRSARSSTNVGATAAHAASRLSWIIWAVVILAITGGGIGVSRCTKGSELLSGLVWDGKDQLRCSGNDRIAVKGVTANMNAGAAIVASGNCEVRCEGCTITAPVAVEANGNAQVYFVNGAITGTTHLADASGGARVTFSGDVKVSGKIKESRAGQVATPAATSAAAAPPTATATSPKAGKGK